MREIERGTFLRRREKLMLVGLAVIEHERDLGDIDNGSLERKRASLCAAAE